MNSNLILIILLSIIVIWCFCVYTVRKTEHYKPYINPVTVTFTAAEIESDKAPAAPWIPQKTPIPETTTLSITPEAAKLLSESVDPGAHIVCQSWCEQKSGKEKTKEFMQVCIDTCMQEKWRKPDSKLAEFKP